MGEITCGITSRPFAAIHIDRPADDEPAHIFGIRQREHLFCIEREFLAPKDFQWAGNDQRRIGNGEANRLLSDIESEEPPPSGKGCRHIV